LKTLTSANSVGFAAGASTESPQIVFRSHPGALVLGALSTDGEALAQNAGNVNLALGARNIQQDGHTLLLADAPLDIVWQRTATAIEIHVFAGQNTTLDVATDNAPTSVIVDGKEIPVRFRGRMVAVPLAGGEEHHVSIQ
jgi:hypothetical protein